MASEITFRPLAGTDIPTLKRWLEDPDVAPWYEEDSTELGALRASYLPIITGAEPTRGYIIRIDDRDAGYIQCYVIDDHPDYARQIAVDPGAVGIDLFLGEPWARDRGHGSRAHDPPVAARLRFERVPSRSLQTWSSAIAKTPCPVWRRSITASAEWAS